MDFEDGERAGGRARGARGPAPGVCLPPQDGRVCGFVLWAARAGDGGPGPDASRPGAARGPAADLAWGASPLPSPAAHRSASLRAPWPPGSVLGRAQGRPQLPGLARRGGPGPRGQRAGGGWSRTSARAGRLGLVRRFSRGDKYQAFHRGGLRSPPEPESASCDQVAQTGLFNNSPRFTCVIIASPETVPGTGALFKAGVGLACACCFGWDSDTVSPGCPSRSDRCTAAGVGLPE